MNAFEIPTRQREALFLACHGPLSMVKGLKVQTKALIKKGLLDVEMKPTNDGWAAYDTLTAPMAWMYPYLGDNGAGWYGSVHYMGTLSNDGRTLYMVRRSGTGKKEEVVAYDASTVPHDALVTLGAVS